MKHEMQPQGQNNECGSETGETENTFINTFEERFQQFYLQLSDGKTGGMVACVDEMERAVESMTQHHDRQQQAQSASAEAGKAEVYREMLQDCRRKAGEATLDRLRKLCQLLARPNEDVALGGDTSGDGLDGVKAMREEETVVASYHAALLGKAEGAANIYGGFLRNRLKQANDAAIKKLSANRALYRLNLASGGASGGGGGSSGGAGGGRGMGGLGDGSDGGGAVGSDAAGRHPHISTLAVVLGEGSKMMIRLSESCLGEAVEESVAELLHQDTKAQAVKILEWLQHDADLPKWQAQVSGKSGAGRLGFSGSAPSSAPNSGNGRKRGAGAAGSGRDRGGDEAAIGEGGGGDGSGNGFNARGMDFVIDEMALACQYCQRYLEFVADDVGFTEDQGSDFYAQVRVVEGAYVQLEDAYCLKSVEEAMRIAEPIEVQNGTYVSSMVEDASFLVHKSLRRSVSTRSEQAIMAVCNRVTEILDPHAAEPSFYGGLATEADHRVPVEPAGGASEEDHRNRPPDDFSTALAKALDKAANADLEESGEGHRTGGAGTSSGLSGVEGAMVGINSVHVALSSVSAIQDALNRFLEADNPLVRLMLDEVARILRAYKELRDSRLNDVLEALSPAITSALANAFGSSSYAIGPTEYELRSADLPGARRLLLAATKAMIGDDEESAGSGKGGAVVASGGGGGCQTALLQDPFEELVRRLACRIASGVEMAARSKGEEGDSGGGLPGAAPASGGSGRGDGGGRGDVGSREAVGFTEWGALLLRKEVRTLQQGLATLMETDSLNTEFGAVNELVRLLNFERPSDALEYRPPPAPRRPGDSAADIDGNGSGGSSSGRRQPVSAEMIKAVLRLRVDFQREAIDALEL